MKGTVKRLYPVWKSETSEFYKREFVITTAEQYPSDVKFSALKEKSDQLNGIAEGDKVNVKFDVKGREYNDRYYVDLNAWRIEKMGAEGGAPADQGGHEQASKHGRGPEATVMRHQNCSSEPAADHD